MAVMVLTRSFQAGTGKGGKEFDREYFVHHVARPIARLLRAEEIVGAIAVACNGEEGNPLAERPNEDGKFPTLSALEAAFPQEVLNGRIIPYIFRDWGPNPGSATALNAGTEIARQQGASWVLSWSMEIDMDGYRIKEALKHAEQHSLSVVGFLRERWWERTQWMVVQNTAALWYLDSLLQVGGLDPRCNGTGKTLYLEGYGEVPLAGMEDFHAMLRMMKCNPNFRWGMVGRADPLVWDVNFEHGSEREKRHLAKVARQYHVMRAWAEEIFPQLAFEQVMDRFFTCYHQD